MGKKRINITLDEGAASILDEVGNGSDYLEKLIGRHNMEWTGALWHIRSCGWRDEEIFAVVDMSKGYHPPGAPLAPGMARAMAEALGRNGVDPDRWLFCADQVRRRPELAQAIWTLAQEYWVGNMAVRRELGRGATWPEQPAPALVTGRAYRLRAWRHESVIGWYLKAVLDAGAQPRPLTPDQLTGLTNGRWQYLELPGEDIARVLEWAGSIEGWPAAGPKPLYAESA